jgi:hypothetical protein
MRTDVRFLEALDRLCAAQQPPMSRADMLRKLVLEADRGPSQKLHRAPHSTSRRDPRGD